MPWPPSSPSGIDDNPLGRLLSQAVWGMVYRGTTQENASKPQDWTTVTRSFVLRRRTPAW